MTGYLVGNQLHACKGCGNAYMYYSSLTRHVREECGQAPKHQCPCCPKKTKLRCNLLKHMRKKHGSNEWNTCLACSKSYKWRKSLHRHVRESPECWPVLLTSGDGEFIRQIHYKMLYNVNN